MPANPGGGPTMHALLDPKTYQNFCVIARGPTPATADRILLATTSEANSYVYLATEGSDVLGKPLLAFSELRDGEARVLRSGDRNGILKGMRQGGQTTRRARMLGLRGGGVGSSV